jgi:hypothetical protein|tara:strand:+ start:1544 stop:2503 length:960 start_codon:yes stop_codon:yes gene_type:complete
MRQFIKLTISFLIVLFTLIFILIESSEYIISQKSNFKLNTNAKYLVLGHSHPECAFNDSLIDYFKNISQSGESYYYTYFKAKKIIEQNPSIETVFIEFTNNQINESMNNWIWKEKYMNHRYLQYSPFMNFTDKMVLAKNNLSGYLNSTSLSFKSNFSRVLKQNFSYSESIGGYLYLERDKTDSLLNKLKINTIDEKTIPISEINLNYLSNLIRFCEEQGKNIFLIRSPQHKKYSGYSNESTYQQIRNNRYSHIEYLDFSKFPLKNSEFGDLEHLNHKGAEIFSIWFAQLLNTEFLEEKNKQVYIDEEIKARTHNNVYKK